MMCDFCEELNKKCFPKEHRSFKDAIINKDMRIIQPILEDFKEKFDFRFPRE